MFPIIHILIFVYALGRNPEGLQLGIVNSELANYADCQSYMLNNDKNYSCAFEKLSCNFLNEIDDFVGHKIFYDTFHDAFRDARKAKLHCIISIASNFTESIVNKKLNWDLFDENSIFGNQISIYMDHTDLHIASFLEHRLFKAYERFNKKILKQCGLHENLEDLALKQETPIYGSFDLDFRYFLYPVLIPQ